MRLCLFPKNSQDVDLLAGDRARLLRLLRFYGYNAVFKPCVFLFWIQGSHPNCKSLFL